jgi:hypothetical protein
MAGRSRFGARAGLRNRVSSQNLREDARIVAETRFLGWFGDRAGTQKPGLARSQEEPGNAFPEAGPRLNPLTNPPFSPLLNLTINKILMLF